MRELQNSLSAYGTDWEEIDSLHDTILSLQSDSEIDVFLQQVKTRLSAPGSGFSLVELSIVLVILGLLVGGVLSGQSLIHAAELRTIIRDQQRYVTATQSFRDKYFALPGDMPNATSFWGVAAACPGTSTTASGGTCNGDGDGKIMTSSSGTNPGNETFRYWQHLAMGGMIEGTYSGTSNNVYATMYQVNTKVNVPAGRVGNGSWQMIYSSDAQAANSTQDSLFWNKSGNGFLFSKSIYTSWPSGTLKPEDAWNVDSKIDDGKPATGSITTMPWDGPSLTGGNCHYPYDIASDPKYSLDVTSLSCDLVFVSGV